MKLQSENGGWKFTKFLKSFLEPRVSFSSKFASLFSAMIDNPSVLFELKLYDFYKRSPSKCKVSDFRLLRCRLLLLKIYKISAEKVQRSYVSWYWRVMQNLKKNQFVVSKMTRIWWTLIQALNSLKNLQFDWLLSCKVYNVWPKKYLWVIFHDTEESCKI